MLNKILTGLAFVLLSGCGAIQNKVNSDVQALTEDDLKAAIARSANDPDHQPCWEDWLAYVQSLPTDTSSAPSAPVAGLADGIEALLTAPAPSPLGFPPIPDKLHKDCRLVRIDLEDKVAAGVAGAAGLLHKLNGLFLKYAAH